MSDLRDESLFVSDAGAAGASSDTSGSGGVSGSGGGQGSSGGDGGTPSAAGTGGDTGGASTGGTAAGAGGAAGSGGVGGAGSGGVGGTGGVGGAAGFVGTGADAGPDLNLVVDPGFESGVTNWLPQGQPLITWESQGPLAGTHCMRVSNRTETWMGPLYPLRGVVTPDVTYRVTAWLRTAHPNQSVKITAKTLCTGAAATTFTEVVSLTSAQNYWLSYTGDFVAPNCPLDEFGVFVEGSPIGEDVYIDEFRIEEIAPP